MNPSVESFLNFFATGAGFTLLCLFVIILVGIGFALSGRHPFLITATKPEPPADASRSRELASVVSMTDRRGL